MALGWICIPITSKGLVVRLGILYPKVVMN